MNSSGWLGYSVREFLSRAAKLILERSKRGPDFEYRIDKYLDLEPFDHKLNRRHPITVRVRVTVRSRIFDSRA